MKPDFQLLEIFSAAFLASCTIPLAAQTYPAHPVRFMIGFAPGSSTDLVTRLHAERLAARLGQPVIAEQKVGASGVLANDAVAKALPDGHTLVP